MSFRNSAGIFGDDDHFFLKCAIFVLKQQYYEQFTQVEIIFCVLQSNYEQVTQILFGARLFWLFKSRLVFAYYRATMSSLRRFFLVFVCPVEKSNIEQGVHSRRANSIGYFR